MTLVLDKFRFLLPKTKSSPSGWISFNAPCCHYRGHARDTRKRAGVMFSEGVVYNCFNCKYTASWQPGRNISEKLKSLCRWLGANDDQIKELVFEALKTESTEYEAEHFVEKVKFTEKELPEGAMPISEWVNSAYLPDIANDIGPVIDYVINRGFDPMTKNFYWSPAPGYIDRVLLPYYYDGKIVGNTARKVREGKPKYLSDQHPFFVFNIDEQDPKNKYVFVVEGQFDALSIGGVGLLTNEISQQQAHIINQLGKEVIVIPDQDKAGLMLIKQATDYDWAVAFPNWEDNVKDVADAVLKYGKLFVIVDAIKTAQQGEIKIKIAQQLLQHKLERLEYVKENN
jgi:hypothetical protein